MSSCSFSESKETRSEKKSEVGVWVHWIIDDEKRHRICTVRCYCCCCFLSMFLIRYFRVRLHVWHLRHKWMACVRTNKRYILCLSEICTNVGSVAPTQRLSEGTQSKRCLVRDVCELCVRMKIETRKGNVCGNKSRNAIKQNRIWMNRLTTGSLYKLAV